MQLTDIVKRWMLHGQLAVFARRCHRQEAPPMFVVSLKQQVMVIKREATRQVIVLIEASIHIEASAFQP